MNYIELSNLCETCKYIHVSLCNAPYENLLWTKDIDNSISIKENKIIHCPMYIKKEK